MDAIRKQVDEEKKQKQSENAVNRFTKEVASDKKLSEAKNEHETKTAHKIATTFNTNRTYVNDASKLKQIHVNYIGMFN